MCGSHLSVVSLFYGAIIRLYFSLPSVTLMIRKLLCQWCTLWSHPCWIHLSTVLGIGIWKEHWEVFSARECAKMMTWPFLLVDIGLSLPPNFLSFSEFLQLVSLDEVSFCSLYFSTRVVFFLYNCCKYSNSWGKFL